VAGLLLAALTVPAIASAIIAATSTDSPNILNVRFIETSPFFCYFAVTFINNNEERTELLQKAC
jgi:hypothetical protein